MEEPNSFLLNHHVELLVPIVDSDQEDLASVARRIIFLVACDSSVKRDFTTLVHCIFCRENLIIFDAGLVRRSILLNKAVSSKVASLCFLLKVHIHER